MKHNSYFDGKVQSLAVSTPDGPATVGVIEPGKYSFGTDCEEHMHIVAGTLKAKLPNGDWKSYGKGQFFVVPPKVKFEVEAAATWPTSATTSDNAGFKLAENRRMKLTCPAVLFHPSANTFYTSLIRVMLFAL